MGTRSAVVELDANIAFTPLPTADSLTAVPIRLIGPAAACPSAANPAPTDDAVVPPGLTALEETMPVSFVAHPANAPAANRPKSVEYRSRFFTGPLLGSCRSDTFEIIDAQTRGSATESRVWANIDGQRR
jgi:hypothetical protein